MGVSAKKQSAWCRRLEARRLTIVLEEEGPVLGGCSMVVLVMDSVGVQGTEGSALGHMEARSGLTGGP